MVPALPCNEKTFCYNLKSMFSTHFLSIFFCTCMHIPHSMISSSRFLHHCRSLDRSLLSNIPSPPYNTLFSFPGLNCMFSLHCHVISPPSLLRLHPASFLSNLLYRFLFSTHLHRFFLHPQFLIPLFLPPRHQSLYLCLSATSFLILTDLSALVPPLPGISATHITSPRSLWTPDTGISHIAFYSLSLSFLLRPTHVTTLQFSQAETKLCPTCP